MNSRAQPKFVTTNGEIQVSTFAAANQARKKDLESKDPISSSHSESGVVASSLRNSH
jgi:hypothetical protein